MSAFDVTQVSPLIANAGITQSISINQPDTFAYSPYNPATSSSSPNGPGWASAGVPSLVPAAAPSTNWPIYIFGAAVVYFLFFKGGF